MEARVFLSEKDLDIFRQTAGKTGHDVEVLLSVVLTEVARGVRAGSLTFAVDDDNFQVIKKGISR